MGGGGEGEKAMSHAAGNEEADVVLFPHFDGLGLLVGGGIGADVGETDADTACDDVPVIYLVVVVMEAA